MATDRCEDGWWAGSVLRARRLDRTDRRAGRAGLSRRAQRAFTELTSKPTGTADAAEGADRRGSLRPARRTPCDEGARDCLLYDTVRLRSPQPARRGFDIHRCSTGRDHFTACSGHRERPSSAPVRGIRALGSSPRQERQSNSILRARRKEPAYSARSMDRTPGIDGRHPRDPGHRATIRPNDGPCELDHRPVHRPVRD